MLVLRVETPEDPCNGRSWLTKYEYQEQYSLTNHWNNLPSPTYDGIRNFGIYYNIREVCGAQSIELFHKWWPVSKINQVHKLGGSIVILSIPKKNVRTGFTQCVFDRNKARIVGYMDPFGHLVYTDKRIKQRL
jgi:hypothetical protein